MIISFRQIITSRCGFVKWLHLRFKRSIIGLFDKACFKLKYLVCHRVVIRVLFIFVLRKLKEEAATEVCPQSAETLKNGITSHALLVILSLLIHTYKYAHAGKGSISTNHLTRSTFWMFSSFVQGHVAV